MTETTQQEKIDYIYERLKKQEKTEKIWIFLKWGFRIFIVWYLYYFITTGLPAMISGLMPEIPSFSEGASDIKLDQAQDIINSFFSQ